MLQGPNLEETLHALAVRLVELGREVVRADAAQIASWGRDDAVQSACATAVAAGAIVLATAAIPATATTMELDANDTPEFGAEKVLDALAEAGIVHLDIGDYTPEEEERIRERLAKLGYIE
jgi:hypothetical protein